ncbi:peptidyl-tRNA hydrolase [Anaerobacterium chartisolvens]|uniref:Peptidyl-tRNA hydrolase n=1 Tax=Anaerobacterium chartisolvens TaxID=1297424 RepID=A0A369BFE7_9FIRM|nr:aminoacyl-tRNA hydrolase [Anaerobacterium chartisolvens]RCX18424.1 peptidyl-tRNA hydrolase [Anaerobacterium chartisolvens]
MDRLFIVVGLGNPGKKYDNTRHNVGFDTLDLLGARHCIKISKLKFKALIGEGSIDGQRVILAKPQTFMNLSGESVRDIADWYKVPLSDVIIIYDDIDLDTGKLRIRSKGSAGTHNGMRSILYHIQSENFPRIRIGIGRPPEGWDLADYVLSRFKEDERRAVNTSIDLAVEAVSSIISGGIETTMSKYNK